jgi:hypothetical protein
VCIFKSTIARGYGVRRRSALVNIAPLDNTVGEQREHLQGVPLAILLGDCFIV